MCIRDREMPPQVIEEESVAVELLAMDPDNAEEPLEYKVRGGIITKVSVTHKK